MTKPIAASITKENVQVSNTLSIDEHGGIKIDKPEIIYLSDFVVDGVAINPEPTRGWLDMEFKCKSCGKFTTTNLHMNTDECEVDSINLDYEGMVSAIEHLCIRDRIYVYEHLSRSLPSEFNYLRHAKEAAMNLDGAEIDDFKAWIAENL